MGQVGGGRTACVQPVLALSAATEITLRCTFNSLFANKNRKTSPIQRICRCAAGPERVFEGKRQSRISPHEQDGITQRRCSRACCWPMEAPWPTPSVASPALQRLLSGTVRRRRFLEFLPLCLPLAAQSEPTVGRSVLQLVIPGAAGSVLDAYARRLSPLLQARLQSPVVVDNRPGANGALAAEAVMRAAADGHTLLLAGMNMLCIAPALGLTTGYDPRRDFEPISLVASGYPLVLVPTNHRHTTLDALLRSNALPGSAVLTVGNAGVGSVQHLAARQIETRTGLRMNHVPYVNAAQVMADLTGGHIDMAIEYASVAVPLLQSGRLRALAVLGPNRLPVLANVPTAMEQGVRNIEAAAWLGMLAPAGTPSAEVSRLNTALHQVVKQPEFEQWVTSNGSVVEASTPPAFATLIKTELERWSALISTTGIRVNPVR